ncbi:zinc-dependent metalloprotease family protein [Flavobacterium alkalisoli]|uniref:zinc-dependent metalloprotease n=1 Tax=Flavobacterium alkalisoli TaxID=2602769 RepID=UPI003A8CA33E
MTKKLLIILIVIMQSAWGYSQSNLWSETSEERLVSYEKTDRADMPVEYQLYHLNFEAMKNVLSSAPSRKNFSGESQVIVSFPNPEGQLERFRIYEASVMHPDLASNHPEIQSYVGKGIDNPTSTIRFSTTIFGLHTITFSTKGTYYIDTYTKDLQNYIVYKKSSLTGGRSFDCETAEADDAVEFGQKFNVKNTQSNDGVLRTYRLAMACTYTYAQYHFTAAGAASGTTAEKKAAVLAAMNVTMTRVNGIYEKDFAITMEIIPNNESVIFVTSGSNPFSNENGSTLLSEVQSVIDGNIGFSNYDIGHVVSTGGGGIAQLGCVCSNSKARGVTGSSNPVGDSYDVDYVCHEMGHQFSARHTFNASGGNSGSCNGNRSAQTAVEPGSGTTIMGYAGICANADVQENSDAYFHAVSIGEVFSFINSINCAEETDNNNAAPEIGFQGGTYIPRATAFVLTATATDADGDALTYCWEETDANGSIVVGSPSPLSTDAPMFRSLSPVDVPERYFPPLEDVLDNNLSPQWQVIPIVGRTLNFALTVRDNAVPNGGQTARINKQIVVLGDIGPFAVTSQHGFTEVWQTNTTETITWDVAGTDQTPMFTTNVDILLSTDGGQTFEMFIENTPNDGIETFTVPTTLPESQNCRVMVRAVDNVYYAVNSIPFAIELLDNEEFGLKGFALYPNPNNGNFTVSFTSATANDINVAVYDMRGRQILSNNYANTGTFSSDINLQGVQSGIYLVSVQDGNRKEVKKIVVQ